MPVVALSAPERKLRAKVAAFERWAKTPNRREATVALRAGFDRRFEVEVNKVDPERRLSDTTRAKLIASARSAYFARLALKRIKKARRATTTRRAQEASRAPGEPRATE